MIVQKVERGGAVVSYQVVINKFLVNVLMLNVAQEAPAFRTGVVSRNRATEIAEVAFSGGQEQSGEQEPAVLAKRMLLDCAGTESQLQSKAAAQMENCPKFKDVEALVIECAFSKVCSMLRIGPQTRAAHGFDVLCFADAIEFYMERCLSFPFPNFRQHRWEDVQARLARCVRTMHGSHLIHKDIKPDNILFSPTFRAFVLADFGISTSPFEGVGAKTLTYREGTLRFMSPEMADIPRNTREYVDLYYNDVYSLTVTFDMLRNERYLEAKARVDHKDRNKNKLITYELKS